MSITAALREAVGAAGLDATGLDDTVPASDVEYRFDPEHTTGLLAEALVALHAVPAPDGGSTDLDRSVMAVEVVDELIDRARRAVAEGVVAPDPAYAHMAPNRLLEVLEAGADRVRAAPAEELVVSHGAPGLDTLRCRDGRAVGFVAWDGLAVADLHRDLAAGATAVAVTLGPMMVPELVGRYGVRPDPVRLDWWALAHQLVPPTAVSPTQVSPTQATSTPAPRPGPPGASGG